LSARFHSLRSCPRRQRRIQPRATWNWVRCTSGSGVRGSRWA
jgi:hypothetical protein